MYELSYEEQLLVARIIAYAMGNKAISLSDIDKESAKKLLKKMADQRNDWTPEQREQFKALVDAVS